MKRTLSLTLAAVALVACSESVPNPTESSRIGVSLASVHLKGGPRAEPSFIDEGLYLRTRGELSGLGNEDLRLTLTAKGLVDATCTNPAGATQPPGQNPAPVTLTGLQDIPASEIKNGTVAFNVYTDEPVTPIPGAPECPNPQWTERIIDVAFTESTMEVEQPTGTLVLTVSCTFSPATSNGAVSAGTVTCTVD